MWGGEHTVVEVTVLGPVGVRRNDTEVELGARLQRLLAALVVADGSVVPADRLVEIVWDGATPRSVESTLRSYMTRLRKVVDVDRDVIRRQKPGYAIDLDGEELDASRFMSELDQGVAQLRSGDSSTAVQLLTAALARWRGPALADMADEEWARPTAVRLEERRLEAREALIEAQLADGMVDVAIADARELAVAEPLRERPRELLMRALYQSGRQAEALREFTAYRRFLAEETGLDPSSELAELEGRIARGDTIVGGATRALGSYELGERIGEGAYSVVHRAVQPGLEREVAIKIIRAELADSPEFVRRFEVEARTIARIEHPHVVPLFDFWREPGAAYLVMRLLRGGTVEEVLRAHGPLSRDRAVEVLEDVGGALEVAHRAGVVHRDVRPANLLLDERGTAYLGDFGIALPTATVDDLPIASPAYAAPEVLRGEPAGVPADVLSLGVSAFEMLTGRLPFADSTDRAELVRRQMSEALPSVGATRSDLPGAVDVILARATAKAPEDRHASVTALVAELREVLHDDRSERPSRRARGTAATRPVENPYVGLHAFDEQDADRFHGREALVTELVEAVEEHRLVVVVGPSGSGKSSVVRAGLLPAIRNGGVHGSESWFVTTMVPGADPIDAFETALLRVAVNPPASLREQLAEPGGMLRAIRRILPDDRSQILVVVDQFEELFTHVEAADERDRFLSELAAAISAPESPLRVVATLRADHYDEPLRHRAIAELATAGTVAVRPMAPGELERAIVAPAAQAGADLEPALVAELVAGVDERPAALPLLQFSLTELFERRTGDVMLLATHRELGGLVGALAARADRIVDAGGPDEAAEVRRIFGRLVMVGGDGDDTRRRALRRELGDGERTAWLLDAFVTARLLSTDRDSASRAPTVEVAHEALLRDWPRLRAWLDEDRADLRILHQVATASAAWDAVDRDPGELARGGRLAAVHELAIRRPDWLSDREAEWIAASVAAAEAEEGERRATAARDRRQNRRLRVLLSVAAVLLVVAIGAALVALASRNRADDARADAEAERQTAIDAGNRAEEARDEAEAERQSAIDAGNRADEAREEAEAERQSAIDAENRAEAARADGEIERLIAQSAAEIPTEPDRAILLALEANRRRDDPATQTAVHRAIASEPRIVSIHPDPFGELTITALSDDGSTGVTASAADGNVVWFDGSTGELLDATYAAPTAITDLAISGDGAVTAVVVRTGEAILLDRDGNELGQLRDDDGAPILVPALDADGDTISVNLGQSPNMLVADVTTGEPLSTFALDGDVPVPHVNDLSPDGALLAVGANSGGPELSSAVMIFDTRTGEQLRRWDTGRVGTTAIAMSADTVVSGHPFGAVEIRSLREDADPDGSVASIPAHAGQVERVEILDDGRVLSAGAGEVRFWLPDGSPAAAPMTVSAEVAAMAATVDGPVTIVRQSGGPLIAELAGGPLVEAAYPEAAQGWLWPYHGYFAIPGPEFRSLELFTLERGETVRQLDLADVHSIEIGPPFYSTDGEWVMTFEVGPPGGPVAVTEITGERQYLVEPVEIHRTFFGEPPGTGSFFGMRPESGGERLFSLARNDAGDVRAGWFALETGELLSGPLDLDFGGPVLLLADGRVAHGGAEANAPLGILPADLDGQPVVVEGTGGLAPLHQDVHTGRIVAGGPGGNVGVVDPDNAEFVPITGAGGTIYAAAFSPDGTLIAVSSDEEGLQLFDAATFEPIGVPVDIRRSDLDFAPGVRWSEDGAGVWVAPVLGGPTRLAASPERWVEIACEMVNRELTPEEWATFVSADSEPVPACDRV